MHLTSRASIATITLALASLTAIQPASAQETAGGADPMREGGSAGFAVGSQQNYFGSDNHRVRAMPTLEYHWDNGWFVDSSRGLGYNFSRARNLQYGIGLGYDLGRKQGDDAKLAGMGDIDAKPVLGLFAMYEPVRNLRLSSTLRYGSGNAGDGMVADLGAEYGFHLAPQWRLGVGAKTSWANASYMQSYFGVTAAQSLGSGYAAYTPSAGFYDVSTSVRLSYQATPKITLSGQLSGSSLVGDAKDSPLVSQPNGTSAGLSFRYAF